MITDGKDKEGRRTGNIFSKNIGSVNSDSNLMLEFDLEDTEGRATPKLGTNSER